MGIWARLARREVGRDGVAEGGQNPELSRVGLFASQKTSFRNPLAGVRNLGITIAY